MSTYADESRRETLEALRRERARRDEELKKAWDALHARCHGTIEVPRAALLAIDAACLVGASTLDAAAIRG
jgi:hypothetical protein